MFACDEHVQVHWMCVWFYSWKHNENSRLQWNSLGSHALFQNNTHKEAKRLQTVISVGYFPKVKYTDALILQYKIENRIYETPLPDPFLNQVSLY
jgi:hypothetical protein